jgi:uncharacterized protein (UPF0261 family)
MPKPPVVLLGTLDTKGVEYAFVRDLLAAQGLDVLVVDAGVQPPAFAPQIAAEQVFAAAGTCLEDIRRANDRGRAVEAAARGAANIVLDLHAQGKVDGVLSLGGSAGTTIGTAAMRALPFGIPKVMVSTLASGQVKHWVGVRDIFMLHSVVDISGLNRVSRRVLTNAALALAGMIRTTSLAPLLPLSPSPPLPLSTAIPPPTTEKPLIAATMFGVTTPCVDACRRELEAGG